MALKTYSTAWWVVMLVASVATGTCISLIERATHIRNLFGIMMWSAWALVGGWWTFLFWHRTRLPFVTLTAALLTLCSAWFAFQEIRGIEPFDYVLSSWAPLIAVVIVTLVGRVLEQKLHPAAWAALEATRRAPNRSFWSVLSGRHIPDLRPPALSQTS